MKSYSIFIEDLKADKEEFNALANVDMGNSTINRRVSDLEVAHGMALTTVSFEFECFMNATSLLSNNKKNNKDIIQSCINNEFLIDLDSSDFNDRQLSNVLRPAIVDDIWVRKFDDTIITDDNIRVSSLTIKDRFRLMDEFNTINEILHALQLTPRNVIPDTQLFINTDKQTLHYHIIKEKIKQVYNTNKVMSSNKKIDTNIKIDQPDYWYIEPDASLIDGPTKYIPVEIISPWVPAKDAVKFVTNFRKKMVELFDIKTTESTSLHCSFRTHIRDKDKKTPLMLNVLKLLALLDEDDYLERFNRKHNIYTKPIQDVLAQLNNNDIDDMEKQLKKALKKNDKYKTINFTDFLTTYNIETGDGRMEIRIIGNDYMGTLFNKAMYSLNEFIQLISAALDNNLYDKEYKDNLNKKINNKRKVQQKQIEEICNNYLKQSNIGTITKAKITLEMLMVVFNTITAFSNIINHEIESLLIKVFTKLSKYIRVRYIIGEWLFKNQQNKSNLLSDFIHNLLTGNKPYAKITKSIKNDDTNKIYVIYDILIKWLEDERIIINTVDKLINYIYTLDVIYSNSSLLDDCHSVINYLDIDTDSKDWKDILEYKKDITNKEKEKIFNTLFSFSRNN